jgi:membrane glycosyltransferase
LAALLTPIAMLSHCFYVVGILSGVSVGWGSQNRVEQRPRIVETVIAFLPHTAIALAVSSLLFFVASDSLWWLAPLIAGAILSIPLAYATSSRRAGRLARRLGLFLVPSETEGHPVFGAAES